VLSLTSDGRPLQPLTSFMLEPLVWVEAALNAIADLSAKERMAVVVLVDGHVRFAAQITLGVTASGEWIANFGAVLAKIIGDPRYAALSGVVTAGASTSPRQENRTRSSSDFRTMSASGTISR
jgi:hypothetical protein